MKPLRVASITVTEEEQSEQGTYQRTGTGSEEYERRSVSRSEVVNRRNTVREKARGRSTASP